MKDNTKLIDVIEHGFKNKKVLVIGDLMVDRYISGKVRKISPEAPVPVLDFDNKRYVAGGASNVVSNLLGLGLDVTITGVIAEDEPGNWLIEELRKRGANTDYIICESRRPTTMKTRYTTKGYQLLRVDHEDTTDISEETKQKIYRCCLDNIDSFDAVIFSDYLKGVLKDKEFVSKLIEICNSNKTYVAVDSKTLEIDTYAGADILTPNVDEVSNAVGRKIETNEDLDRAAKDYLNGSGAKSLIITRGEKGISVYEKSEKRKDFPAKDVEVFDVSGAGDTVLSTITAGVVSGLSIDDSVRLANYAASVVITKRGTAAITGKELLKSLNEEQNS